MEPIWAGDQGTRLVYLEVARMIDEIQKRRDHALRTARELLELSKSITRLEQETNSISDILSKLRNGSKIEENELKSLGLIEIPPLMLKIRLQGLLSKKNKSLADLGLKHRNIKEMLKKLATCPACNGQGVVTQRQYIRSEGIISPQIKMENCAFCGGTGKINLGEDIMRLIESVG